MKEQGFLPVCRADMAARGVDTLYLCTDHTSFYERYGWEFYCMVEEDGGGECRLYRRVQSAEFRVQEKTPR